MKKLYNIIDSIYEECSYRYSNKTIEKAIMDAIVLLLYKELRIEKLYIFDNEANKELSLLILPRIKNVIPKYALSNDYLISNIYEYVMDYRKKDKEKLAIYYTSKWIVDYILDNTLILNNRIIDIKRIKILEPSCGVGNFLIPIIERLFSYYKDNTNLNNKKIIYYIFKNNLYGIDKDPVALKYCRHTLFLKIFRLTGEIYDLEFNLFNIDFLNKGTIENNKFDFILGNPPYLENRKINKYYQKDYLKIKYQAAVGRFDIYALFIERSIKLLKEKGEIGYIIPASILANNNFSKLRQIILNNCNIERIVNLGDGIFDSVDMNMIVIIMSKSLNGRTILSKDISHSNYKKEQLYLTPYKKIKQAYYNELLNNVFDINSSDIFFKIRNRIFKESSYRIKDYCDVVAGVATGNIRSKLITKREDIDTKKVLEGKNVNRYHYHWKDLYIRTDKSLINKSNGEYATFMREDLVYNEKILIRQTADRFICAYDNQNYHLLNTLYSLVVKDNKKQELSIKFLLAILNSSLYSSIYRSLTMENGKLFPQVKIYHIKESPFNIIPYSQQKYIINIVDEIIESYNDQKANLSNKKLYIESKLSIIDNYIYDIYHISNRERMEIENLISNV